MKRKQNLFALLLLAFCLTLASVASGETNTFYQPSENAEMDYSDASSRWSFTRCLETNHYYIFWEPDFGNDPGSDLVPEELRVDVQDLAEKLEQFYETETASLGFDGIESINGYKMQVYLLYTEDWVATGSGYDNQIGALWVSPSTCHPVGSVIAHEAFNTWCIASSLQTGRMM